MTADISREVWDLYKMFGINPSPRIEEKIRTKIELSTDEIELVEYLETGKLPTNPKALFHVEKPPATDDS